MKNLKILFFIPLFIISCNNYDPNRVENCSKPILQIKKIKFSQKGEIFFNLDSIQYVGEFTGSAYLEDRNQIIFLDNISNRLIFFDSKGGEKINEISIKKAVQKQKIQGFRFINADSIILYSNITKTIFLIDNKSHLKWSYTFKPIINPSFENLPPPSPYISNSSPIYIINQNFVCTGFLVGEHEKEPYNKRFCRIKVTLCTKKELYDVLYPEIYRLPNWGGDLFRSAFSAYNAKTKQMIISTPANHNITLIDSMNARKEIFFGPKNKLCIPSFKYSKSDRERFNNIDLNTYFFTNPSYRNILYDAYRDFYYRILEIQLPKQKLNRKGIGQKDFAVLIYNSKFEYQGEFVMPSSHSSEHILITKEGVLFLNKNNKDENQVKFFLYNPS